MVHRGTDCVLSLHSRALRTVDQEVATDHRGIVVPAFKIVDCLSCLTRESESGCSFIYLNLSSDLKSFVLDQMLPIEHAYDHSLNDVKCGLAVVMWASDR